MRRGFVIRPQNHGRIRPEQGPDTRTRAAPADRPRAATSRASARPVHSMTTSTPRQRKRQDVARARQRKVPTVDHQSAGPQRNGAGPRSEHTVIFEQIGTHFWRRDGR